LGGDSFAADAKNADLPRTKKVHRAWLQRIMRQMDLLCKIKTIVAGFCGTAR